jgi:hypothetical protein
MVYGRLPTVDEAVAIRGFAASRLSPLHVDPEHRSAHAVHMTVLASVWRGVKERTSQMKKDSSQSHKAVKPQTQAEAKKGGIGKKRKRKPTD